MAKNDMTIKLVNFDQVVETLKTVAPNEARNIMRGTVQKLAEVAAGRLMVKVKHKTGKLAKTIRAVRRRGKENLFVSQVRLGAKAPYGIILEFGSRNTKAQPYIVPTVEELRPQMAEYYREEFANRLARALKRRHKKAAV